MKRSPLLQPFSREHHHALKLARLCQRAVQSGSEDEVSLACRQAVDAFALELEPHFQEEEHVLMSRLEMVGETGLAQRAIQEHMVMRALKVRLQAGESDALREFAHCLSEHVRFEERELFPLIEQRLFN